MDHLQQFESQLKQTCLVTWPSATVGWVPFNQPVEWVPQRCIGTQVVAILVPAAPWKRNQPGPSELSQVNGTAPYVFFLSPFVKFR